MYLLNVESYQSTFDKHAWNKSEMCFFVFLNA